MRRRGLLLALALSVTACGVPIQVVKVTDPTAPTLGVRYRIKRPVYKVSLRLNPDAEPRYEVVVTQVLNDEATYEATTHPNPFADTEISIVTDDPGALSSFSAGETDKSVETITAAIGLAKAAAAFAPECNTSLVKAISDLSALDAEYVREEAYGKALSARVITLTDQLTQELSHTPPDPKRVETLRRQRARLMKALAAAKSRLDALRAETVPVSKKDFRVVVKDTAKKDSPAIEFGSGTCLTITLTPKDPL